MSENQSAKDLLEFINESPCCFYAVENLRSSLIQNGFEELFEGDSWKLKKGGKYFVKRNGSSIISFVLPENDVKGFLVTASHSDSPGFKVKENPEMTSAGFVKLNVEKYGGLLMNPWFDRPLSLAGRITVANPENSCGVKTLLINFKKDLLVIPSLAIHLDRNANEGHAIDVQGELMPVISQNKEFNIKAMIAKQADVKEEDILGFDLFVYARDKGTFIGENDDFILSPRLDDLECVWTTFKAFINASKNVAKEKAFVHAVFDNEEVGSQSRQGAASTFLQDVLKRINLCFGQSEEQYYQAVANSMLVSADNAHSVHPNYASSSDPVNQPVVNGGPVIKFNASQKYTSDSVSAGIFKRICNNAKIPYQVFTNNSNIAGGSTLGNISTSQVSFLSVDIGLAQWAMHSPVETAGAKDVDLMIKAVESFYKS